LAKPTSQLFQTVPLCGNGLARLPRKRSARDVRSSWPMSAGRGCCLRISLRVAQMASTSAKLPCGRRTLPHAVDSACRKVVLGCAGVLSRDVTFYQRGESQNCARELDTKGRRMRYAARPPFSNPQRYLSAQSRFFGVGFRAFEHRHCLVRQQSLEGERPIAP